LKKIPEKHFEDLLVGYDTEQSKLDSEIAELQTAIDTYNTDSVRADKFIELVKRHTEFNEFSATLLNEFIEKIIVHEAVKIDGRRTQQIDIHFTFIGKSDIPLTAEEIAELEKVEEVPPNKRKKKRRCEMTLEQVEREREADRRYHAKKRDERLAAELTQRAEILQGTSYELAV
jgi:hypothetical protein